MGQTKNIQIEFNDKLNFLEELLDFFSKADYSFRIQNSIVGDLPYILRILKTIGSNDIEIMMDLIHFVDDEFVNEFRTFIENPENDQDNKKSTILQMRKIKNLRDRLSLLRNILENKHLKQNEILNSKAYYSKRIKELESQKEKLEHSLTNQNNQKKQELEEKKQELELAKQQIQNYEKKLEVKDQEDYKREEWDSKIKTTFDQLKLSLSPITKEHRRLTILYWLFFFLTSISIMSVITIEIILFNKLTTTNGFPLWNEYLVILSPLPILVGLLWAFISQTNRNQRQLVILAKHIHEIEYIEGLLLAVNWLSPGIDESIKRLNTAMEKLIDNQLNSHALNVIDENSMKCEERKDLVPAEVVLKILRESKSILSK